LGAQRKGREGQRNILVLNRSCADLHAEITELFADRPDIEIIVDRRRGKGGMVQIPLSRRRPRSGQGNKPV